MKNLRDLPLNILKQLENVKEIEKMENVAKELFEEAKNFK